MTNEYPYAGMILPDASDLDPGPYLQAAATILSRVEPDVRLRKRSGQVLGQDFAISVTPEEDSDYGPRMLIEITTPDGGEPEDETAAQLLSDTVLLALENSEADILEWYSPDVLIDREDFIRLRSYVSPRRGSGEASEALDEALSDGALPDSLRAMLDPIPERGAEDDRPSTTDRLAHYRVRLEQAEPADQRIRSAGWLMAGAVGVFAAPLALFLFIVSFYRGMDFRLVSQAMAVTALFVVLYNTDRLQMVLHQLTH